MWVVLLITAIVLSGALIRLEQQNQQLDKKTKQQFELYRKEVEQKQLEQVKSFTDEQQRQREDLEKQIKKLQDDLQSKANRASQNALIAKVVPQAQAATNTAYSGSGDAKSFIYAKESGNNPGAINKTSGACGLGQALPCSKMPCSLSDYACQDNFFTGYMQSRYGTWDNAKSFWLAHGWW